MLLAGRDCESGFECYSGSCEDGRCTGLTKGDYCAVNNDCGANMFCKKQSVWPYRAKCNGLLGDMEICSSDNDCQARYFCWYATVAEKASAIKR
jgi:hypothetical protein